MAMKFGRAYCVERDDLVSPYTARAIYTDEDDLHCGVELTFKCEDPICRANLTPVGIYMLRKSKRALHFRTRDEHTVNCSFLKLASSEISQSGGRQGDGDAYKPTIFPTELDLNPPKSRSVSGTKSSVDSGDDDASSAGGGGLYRGDGKRRTSTRTLHLDHIVDCFLSGDEAGKKGKLTVAGKTKQFGRFFKRIRYFTDEEGLIYYGSVDRLIIYPGQGIGLRFADSVWVEDRSYRVWVYVPQDVLDASRKKINFLKEVAELQKAVEAKEEVIAFFVGVYPVKTAVEIKDREPFDVYRAEVASVNHLSLAFSE